MTDFTQNERLILYNQCEILKLLNPDQSDYYEQLQTILEYGYEREYHRVYGLVQPSSSLTVAECGEVHNILEMFTALQQSSEYIPEGIQDFEYTFHGFDGNHEGSQLSYLHYLSDKGDWETVIGAGAVNSHMPTLARYRSMVATWKSVRKKRNLSEEDIVMIVEAGKPENYAP